jgi:putative Ca2+/H+ antiporter (TMEM165/GDT1 family)
LLAIALGRYTARRIEPRRFLVYVHAGLFVIGVVLFLQAVAASRR